MPMQQTQFYGRQGKRLVTKSHEITRDYYQLQIIEGYDYVATEEPIPTVKPMTDKLLNLCHNHLDYLAWDNFGVDVYFLARALVLHVFVTCDADEERLSKFTGEDFDIIEQLAIEEQSKWLHFVERG